MDTYDSHLSTKRSPDYTQAIEDIVLVVVIFAIGIFTGVLIGVNYV